MHWLVRGHGARPAGWSLRSLAVLFLCLPTLALGATAGSPALLCRGAIASAEEATGIPDEFLSAIGRVESGRKLSEGNLAPWPWTVNAAGVGHFYATRAEAVDAVRQFHAQGVQSLDVGCLQVSLLYHPEAFASIEQAFDPAANAAYAARLLLSLKAETGSWPRAAAAYHSGTPSLGQDYQRKVLAQWAEPDDRLPGEPPGRPQTATPASLLPAPSGPGPVSLTPTASAAPPPAVAFAHSTLLPAAPGNKGWTLSAYRALPVRLAMRAPAAAISIR